jgi:hypothetical protein
MVEREGEEKGGVRIKRRGSQEGIELSHVDKLGRLLIL